MTPRNYELRITNYEAHPARHTVFAFLRLAAPLPLTLLRDVKGKRSRFGLAFRPRVCVLAGLGAVLVASAARGQTRTIRVDLELRTGGALSGPVVDHTSHGIVVMHDTTPYVFSWDEIKADSAYVARRDLRILDRGGLEKLTAQDHFRLGLFALSRNLTEQAARDFAGAEKLDRSYKPRARQAFVQYNEKKRQRRAARSQDKALVETQKRKNEETQKRRNGETGERENSADAHRGPLETAVREVTAGEGLSPETRQRVISVYKSFGETVRQEVCEDLTLIETDHFLIFTDWTKGRRGMLGEWCEAMYAALCARFSFDASEPVFLAKCPVFCWRSKTRFMEFARRFDGYDGTNAIGYTRSMADSGHVHIVLLRQGRSEADFDRFACTLVHEGTHAFLHRLFTTRLIPHWVNEGYADLVAERVLGDRCASVENAALLARQYVRYDWPIAGLLEHDGPIDVHQYALAHSVVRYLEGLGRPRFAAFIRSLKSGQTTTEALADQYDGMTLDQLQARWRSAIRAADPQAQNETRP